MILLLILLATGAYLYALPGASLLFVAGVLLHIGTGAVAIPWLARFLFTRFRQASITAKTGWLLIVAGAALGGALTITGTTRPYQPLMMVHIGLSLAGLVIVAADASGPRRPKAVLGPSGRVDPGGRFRVRRRVGATGRLGGIPNRESRTPARKHARRRRWTRWAVLSQFVPDEYRGIRPGRLFHGIRKVPAMPRGRL